MREYLVGLRSEAVERDLPVFAPSETGDRGGGRIAAKGRPDFSTCRGLEGENALSYQNGYLAEGAGAGMIVGEAPKLAQADRRLLEGLPSPVDDDAIGSGYPAAIGQEAVQGVFQIPSTPQPKPGDPII
jgi:hypothetical protein